jgi:hypothetical protein
MIEYVFKVPLDSNEPLTSERILTRCRWQVMEINHELYPHVFFGWAGDKIIQFIHMIADPDEEDEVLGRIREKREG